MLSNLKLKNILILFFGVIIFLIVLVGSINYSFSKDSIQNIKTIKQIAKTNKLYIKTYSSINSLSYKIQLSFYKNTKIDSSQISSLLDKLANIDTKNTKQILKVKNEINKLVRNLKIRNKILQNFQNNYQSNLAKINLILTKNLNIPFFRDLFSYIAKNTKNILSHTDTKQISDYLETSLDKEIIINNKKIAVADYNEDLADAIDGFVENYQAYWLTLNKVNSEISKLIKKDLEFINKLKDNQLKYQQTKLEKIEKNNKNANSIVLTISLLLFVVVIIIYFMFKNIILNNIFKLTKHIENISKNGEYDFTQKLDLNIKNEIGILGKELSKLLNDISDSLIKIKDISNQNINVSNEIKKDSNNINQEIILTNEKLDDISLKGTEINSVLKDNINESQNAKDMMTNVYTETQNIKEVIDNLYQKVEYNVQNQNEISHELQEASQNISDIANVISIISDIADQTNLLALNAAIEAARAGEHGRGFAVVAEEVRNLAEKTQKSLSEIESSIKTAVDMVNNSSQNVVNASKDINELLDIVQSANTTISSINNVVDKASNSANNNMDNSLEVSKKIKSILNEVDEIHKLSNENEEMVHNLLNISHKLSDISTTLQEDLEKYKL